MLRRVVKVNTSRAKIRRIQRSITVLGEIDEQVSPELRRKPISQKRKTNANEEDGEHTSEAIVEQTYQRRRKDGLLRMSLRKENRQPWKIAQLPPQLLKEG
ncbi:hypothetical protein COOONC_02128 [Cooperia oncophora]